MQVITTMVVAMMGMIVWFTLKEVRMLVTLLPEQRQGTHE